MAKKNSEAKSGELPDPATAMGRMVRFVMGPKDYRPALVTQVSADGTAQVSVFKAHSSDLVNGDSVIAGNGALSAVALVGSVAYDEDETPGTWHWPVIEPVKGN